MYNINPCTLARVIIIKIFVISDVLYGRKIIISKIRPTDDGLGVEAAATTWSLVYIYLYYIITSDPKAAIIIIMMMRHTVVVMESNHGNRPRIRGIILLL